MSLSIAGGAALPSSAVVSATLHPVADTCLFETDPGNNQGAELSFAAGTTAAGFRSRGLVKFDLSQIPPNASILSVTLTLKVTGVPAQPASSTFGLHRALQDWGEGSKTGTRGASATAGEATWLSRFYPANPWTPAGGGSGVDYTSSTSATCAVSGLGSYPFNSTAGLVADVQTWLANPGANFGWILISDSEGTSSTARRFASREDTANAPTLVISYTLPSPATPPTISRWSVVGNRIQFSFDAEAGRTYAVEVRSALGAGSWTTLRNIAAQTEAATITISDSASGPGSFYRIRTP